MKYLYTLGLMLLTHGLLHAQQYFYFGSPFWGINAHLQAGVGTTPVQNNISDVLHKYGYEYGRGPLMYIGIGATYQVSEKLEVGISAVWSSQWKFSKSHNVWKTGLFTLGYRIGVDRIAVIPTIGVGGTMQKLYADIYEPEKATGVKPETIEITNGWFTGMAGIDVLRKTRNGKYEYGITYGYQIGLGKQDWDVLYGNVKTALRDGYESMHIGLKVRACF